jgi:Fe-S cluster assembly protein SufB
VSFTPPSYQFGFADPESSRARTERGLTEATVREISALKNEPRWMLEKRLAGFAAFQAAKFPSWGPDLSKLHLDEITFFSRATDRAERTWDDVPDRIKTTFDRLGVPQAERALLAGVGAQYDSEAIYHNLKQEWQDLGVIFCDMDTAVREHPELVQKYFGTIIPATDNMFAALNTAVWSGGSFVYIPKGVKLSVPLQAYFRINANQVGQFERTIIIAEPDSYVHYVEGCSAPTYSDSALHAAVVEVFCKSESRVRYTTIQNWSNAVYNLVTKRAVADRAATMEWVDCNLGSQVTMKYPSVLLREPYSRAEILSLAIAGSGQHQDAGAKAIHLAPHTSSLITSKSVSFGSGRTSYRGIVKATKAAHHVTSKVVCDALLLNDESRSDTYPTIDIQHEDNQIEHEASVSKVGEEQLLYLQNRGLKPEVATALIVNGFMEPIVKELPMEYAVEMNRLIELEMEGSVG